ncbi:MAG: acyl-CoA dehydrogenase family protein, partial [Alphaproteobacteria bacterium]|nr:acyl-CoA dehydrogenase family protein [Alphaproteobacteria bacterium]
MGEVNDTSADEFRGEVRDWLAANFPLALKHQADLVALGTRVSSHPDLIKWRTAIGAKGWSAPTWPKEYGGGGLSTAQARIVSQEMARAGAFNP